MDDNKYFEKILAEIPLRIKLYVGLHMKVEILIDKLCKRYPLGRKVINFLGGLREKRLRRKYVKAMMFAIKRAQTNVFDKEPSSKTDALRAIRRFERVNNIQFNPFNKAHLNTVAGCGTHENFFRKIKLAQKHL